MKSIVFFVTGLENGGLENYLLRFLKDRNDKFEDIIVYCKGGKSGFLESEYKSLENVSIVVNKIGYFNFYSYLKLFFYLLQYKDYTICDFTGTMSGIIMLVAKLAGIKNRIVFYRESVYQFKKSFIKSLYVSVLEKCVLLFSTSILANSEFAFENIFKSNVKDNSKFKVIYNGLNVNTFLEEENDLRKELNIDKDVVVVGHVGRYTNAKNHKTIISTCIELCKKYDKIVFLFCGKDVRENVECKIPKEFIDRFFLLENRRDIPCVLNTIDIFYFPSINEGQPNALIEAMVKGKKIVASNIPTIKECVPSSFHSFLVNPLSVNDAVKLIDSYLANTASCDLKEWSIKVYDSEKKFNEFEEILIM